MDKLEIVPQMKIIEYRRKMRKVIAVNASSAADMIRGGHFE